MDDSDHSVEMTELSCKIIIIGDCNVGKSSFVQRYVNEQFEERRIWTAGVDFAVKEVVWDDRLRLRLQLWDIAGQERYSSMLPLFYRNTNACIVMFDLSQRPTFYSALRWKRQLDEQVRRVDGAAVPCLLLANKCDLDDRAVNQNEIELFVKDHKFLGWTETSVKEGRMVEEAVSYLLESTVALLSSSVHSERHDMLASIKLSDSDALQKPSKCACL